MPDPTIKERHARLKVADKERGIVTAKARIPKGRREELRAICAAWRLEAFLARAQHREMIASMDDRG
jgi:hypothetical protein